MENRIEEIKHQFIEVIKYSQEIIDPQVDQLFEEWYEAKKDFITAMNGELIYEFSEKVNFELDEKSKEDRVAAFISRIYNFYGEHDLANFIDFMQHCFFQNLTDREYFYEGEKIPKGTRILKDFKYFIKDKDLLERLQNEASRILQEDKVEGKLCLSVHPLDFLSSSENTHNWRSCHSLDGEYRSGNLSYMVDKSTIMCYLKSDREEILPNFPPEVKWNSKKWRMLLFFSDKWEMMFAGRQYPFSSQAALTIIKDTLLNRAGIKGAWDGWHGALISGLSDSYSNDYHAFNHKYIPVGNELMRLDHLVEDGVDAMHFNDLLKSSCYSPLYAYKLQGYGWKMGNKKTHFRIGGPVPCVDCGREHILVNESMRCYDCEADHGHLDNDEFGYCDCCGRHFRLDDAIYINDSAICPSCVDNGEAGQCENCGEWFFKEDLVYDHKHDCTICRYCNED